MIQTKKKSTIVEFGKMENVEKELVDKLSLWILRIIINLGGHKEFINKKNYFASEEVAYFLKLEAYVEMDNADLNKFEVRNILKTHLHKLEKRKRFTSSKILTKNIKNISKLMDLNLHEEQILEFVILLNQYSILSDAADLLGYCLNTTQVKRVLSVILDIPITSINDAFKPDSKLHKSSILTIDSRDTNDLVRKIDIISSSFTDNMLHLDEDISQMIKETVMPCKDSALKLADYTHVLKHVEILIPYLQSAIKEKQEGVNILLYGLPGTGKTELVKVISKVINTTLYEISYADRDNEAIDGKMRLQAYAAAQSFFAMKDTMLMFDEAEDVFDSSDSIFSPKKQNNKAWINRVLENNTIPTIWITNNINSIDNAMIRRFDMSIEMPIPKKTKRAQIIKNYSKELLDEQSIALLAENEDIAPALITRTAKVVNAINTDKKAEAFKHIINSTLMAQGYDGLKETITNPLPSLYDPRFINTTVDLETLAEGIKQQQNARLCLYGAAGTGKSAFGRYIAETLDKTCLLKKGSDLISKWVGGTEKNIANAFKEAKEEKAVLIFDEVDSFLADRTQAKQSWEVTQVNEMLVQMENFDGIFIATTNLMNNLDRASLRRFDLKLEFDYLKSEQSWKMFLSYCKELSLKKPPSRYKQKIESLRYLTPGDFAAITRQNRFRPIKNVEDFIERLKDEEAVKIGVNRTILGFKI